MIEFKGSQFERDIILWGVRSYVAYPVSYRQLKEMVAERGVEVDHSSLNRWVLKYTPLLEMALRKRKRPVGTSWRLDETYISIKDQWKFLYRAVDKAGYTVGILLTAATEKPPCAFCASPSPVRNTREDHDRQERRQHRSYRKRSSRQRPDHRAAPVEVPQQQHRRARPPCDQSIDSADAGIQIVLVGCNHACRHRARAHDSQGAADLQRQTNGCETILLVGWLNERRATKQLPIVHTKTLRQNRDDCHD